MPAIYCDQFLRKHTLDFDTMAEQSAREGMAVEECRPEEEQETIGARNNQRGKVPAEETQGAVLHHSSSMSAAGVGSQIAQRVHNDGSQNPIFLGPVQETTIIYNIYTLPGKLTQQKEPSELQDCSAMGRTAERSSTVAGGSKDEALRAPDKTAARHAADRCEKVLKTLYTTTGSYVQMLPCLDDDTKHITDILTPLKLVNTVDTVGEVHSLQDILLVKTKEDHLIKRGILVGLPDSGTTTVIAKVAYDWADSSSDELKKYKLVFKLKMHALRQNSGLIDAIFDQLLDEDTSTHKSALKYYIDTNPDKVLILLDGFDGFMTTSLCETSYGSVLNMLNQTIHRECFVIVSTRPSHLDKLKHDSSLMQQPFTHVEAMGFKKEDIKQYARHTDPSRVHAHVPYMDPHDGESDEPDMDRYDEPDVESYDEPDVDRYDEPDMDRYDEPDVDRYGEPDVESYDEPDVDRCDEPDVESYDEPDVDRCDEPDVDSYYEPDVESYDEPNVDRYDKPDVDSYYEPDVDLYEFLD